MRKMTDCLLSNKRVLIREDFNVPIKNGKIVSDARILAALPTLRTALDAGARVMIMSHLGRPKEGEANDEYSLNPVARHLSNSLNQPVRLIKDWVNTPFSLEKGELVLLENTRFNLGEKHNDEQLARKMANLCDVFVMDAFGVSHRAQASTYGVMQYAPIICAGPLLIKEVTAISKALHKPKRPMIAIVGGSKVSTKLNVLQTLSALCDGLIVGGGIANTFLFASGKNIGMSLYEPGFINQAKKLIKTTNIPLPIDVLCATKFDENEPAILKSVGNLNNEDMILDIGLETQNIFNSMLQDAGTILWNGPVGVFEFDAFGNGTKALALSIAKSPAFSIAGGGDTLAAIDKYGIRDKLSYISTGGGAFLELVEGKKLPALAILESRYL